MAKIPMEPTRSHNTRDDDLDNPTTGVIATATGCEWCGRPSRRKYCDQDCYAAKRRSGDDAARFWAKVRKGPDCWLWTANRTGGRDRRWYGQFTRTVNGAQEHIYAHRFVWELTYGPVSDGAQILHRCDTPLCVNPEHLFLGDHKANMEDAAQKGRLHAPRPTGQKISDDDVDRIVALVRSGQRRADVASQFNVSKSFVTRVMSGTIRQWRPSVAGHQKAS